MTKEQFEKEWADPRGSHRRAASMAVCDDWSCSPESVIVDAQKQRKRYTEMLMEVCGVKMEYEYNLITRQSEEWLVIWPSDLEKISNATPEQRLHAAGLTGCTDD